MERARTLLVLITALLAGLTGCSSLTGSAIRTGPLRLPPHVGPVAIYAAGLRPQGRELGLVEVHAQDTEATVETLLPLFVQKVASLGGNAAVIDGVNASFEVITHAQIETYYYPCGFHATCTGRRMTPMSAEVMTVSMHGRAIAMDAAPREGEGP
jgi:hypothetical protein